MVPPASYPRALLKARRRMWVSLLFILIAIGVGGTLDRAYHARYPFDTFFSPPHLFIYGNFLAAIAVLASVAFSAPLRAWFGPGFRVALLPFEVPGPLAITGGGMACVAIGGALDDAWHSSFGLDETTWSVPHAMLAWGLLVTFLGFVSCRLALAAHRPMSRLTPVLLGVLVLAFSVGPVLGPLGHNNTPDVVRATAAIPVLAGQPEAQHTVRIYEVWNVDRTNPAFIPLSALWGGLGLALVRGLDRRPIFLGVVAAISSLFTMLGDRGSARFLDVSGDPASWLPLPILPVALLLLLIWSRGVNGPRAWAAGGLAFGFLVYATWGSALWAALLVFAAPPAMIIGASLGGRTLAILKSPSERADKIFVPLVGVGMPLLVGALDLYLRAATP